MSETVGPPGSPGWWRARYTNTRRLRPRPDGLSLDKILVAALEVLDAEGLDALTMRRLAEHLHTTHTSLYRHVTSRDELMVLLVDHVLGEMRIDGQPRNWRQAAAAQAREFRRVLLSHPALVGQVTAGQLLGPNAMRSREAALKLSVEAGADPLLAVHAYLLLAHFVIGSALLDSGGAARTQSVRTAMTDLFRSVPSEDFPTVVQLAEILNNPDSDAEFEFGLRCALDGIEHRLSPANEKTPGRV